MHCISRVQGVLLFLSLFLYCDGIIPPIFDHANQHLSIKETTPNGTVIGNITVTDESDRITLTRNDANTRQYVTLHITEDIGGRTSADVILNKPLDFEANPTVVLQFLASNTAYSQIGTITLIVQDVNDNPPVFEHQPYLTRIPEDAANGSVVFNASVSDVDTSYGGVVNVSLLTHTDMFEVILIGEQFEVTLLDDLDYEQIPFYNVKLKAWDKAGNHLSSQADLFVTVTDVQDTPPYFTGLPYIPEIWENHPVNSMVSHVTALDGDRGNPENISFSMNNSTCPSFFSIETNGTIKLLKKADRDIGTISENNGICILTVKATEVNGGTLQSGALFEAYGNVTVTVKDVNDNSPSFSWTRGEASIRENMPAGVPLTFNTSLQAVDSDQGDNAKFTLSLSTYAEYFELTPSEVQGSSVIQVKVANSSILDYEVRRTLQLKIVASEGPSISTATVTLHIENENDNSPEFNKTSYPGSVLEGSATGTSVLTVTAVDHDAPPYNTVTYQLLGADGMFSIDDNGMLTTSSNPTDRETRSIYYMTVEASDSGGRKETAQLTINITDANDNPPLFSREYEGYLEENKDNFNKPIVVQATDADIGTNAIINYTIERSYPHGWESHFHVDSISGQLSVQTSLDYERLPGGQLVLEIRATDSGQFPLHSDVNVTINLQDVNDNTPKFTSPAYRGHVSEADPSGTPVLQVAASDADGSPQYNTILYTLGGSGSDKFQIDGNNGTITVVGRLDREQVAQYNLTVTAMDRGTPPRENITAVVVFVDDVNDEKPSFTLINILKEVNETTITSTLLYTVEAKDMDDDSNLSYTVFWNESSAIDENFVIVLNNRIKEILELDSVNGEIRLLSTLDREEVELITLKLHVVDLNAVANAPQTATATLTLSVLDIDDNSPTFNRTSYTATIAENSVPGIPIDIPGTSITVSDKDKDRNSIFSLSLRDNADVFEVVPEIVRSSATVLVRVKNSTYLDYELHKRMTLTLMAIETEARPPRSSSVQISLNISDTNDNDPVFVKTSYQKTILENSQNNTVVLRVNATDADSSKYGLDYYTIQGSQSTFSIDADTGMIQVSSSQDLDRERQDTYTLTVEAVDKGGRRDSTVVTISLLDVNDNAPVFTRVEYTADLVEGNTHFERAVKVEATDDDKAGTKNSRIRFSLSTSEPLNTNFSINSASGVLTPRGPIDYESLASPTVVLVIIATDEGSPPLNSTVNLTITVQDTNDNSPLFNATSYSGNVTESAKPDTTVLQVTASDADGTPQNSDILFTLGGSGSDKFEIDGNNGTVTVVGKLDREQVAEYNLTVTAMDRGTPPRENTAAVVITLINVNDEVPSFRQSNILQLVNETSVIHTVDFLYKVVAEDKDENANLSYSVFWNESMAINENFVTVSNERIQEILELDSASGEIRLLSTLDREEVELITLKLHVVDLNAVANTPQTATATLTLSVLDIDDNSPTFNRTSYTATIAENSVPGIPIDIPGTSITVSDKDKDRNSIFSLSLRDNADVFEVVPEIVRSSATVLVRVKNSTYLDYELHKRMTLTLMAIETEARPPRSSSVQISLIILDANDNNPEFVKTSYQKTIPENSPNNTVVLQVNATDADSSTFGLDYYTIQGSQSTFAIDADTGMIRVSSRRDLDRERQDTYTLTVEAVDKGGRRDSTVVTISLSDVNDNAPVFSRVEYTADLVEGKDDFERPVQVQSTDADEPGTNNSEIWYSLSPTRPLHSNFSINSTSGILTPDGPIDYESLKSPDVLLVVTASDYGTPTETTNINVTIHVQDANDNTPEFTLPQYDGNVSEDAKTDTSILKVNATDADGTRQNSDVFYTLQGQGSDKFQIDGATGVISVVGILDRETVPVYNLMAIVMDRGTPPRDSNVSVTITVDNVNDEKPMFVSELVEKQVKETNVTGTVLYNMSAIDNDDDADLHYEIMWNKSSAFDENLKLVSNNKIQDMIELNASTGSISLKTPLDREQVELITLSFQVKDLHQAAGTHQTATATLRLTVLDVDDNTPTFRENNYTAEITEDSLPGIPISLTSAGLMTVSDKDKDLNSIFSLSLLSHGDVFDVVPSTARSEATVIIRVRDASALDYEATQSMNITVLANETRVSNPRSSTVWIYVEITDANDNYPNFTQTVYTSSVHENIMQGATVVTVSATDADSSKWDMDYYQLQGNNPNFDINSTYGMIVVSSTSDLDRERQDSYQLIVEAVDKGGLRTSATVTITLLDVNDNSPIFSRLEYNANLIENDDSFVSDLQIKASDEDEGENGNITFSIEDHVDSLDSNFSINPTTGKLTPRRPVDYEALKSPPSIQLVVRATDHGYPPRSSGVNVTINVQDVNDNTPTFTAINYHENVSEKASTDTSILQVRATDADGTRQNSDVFYTLQGRGSDKFQIDGATGVISVVGILDRETVPVYNLTAKVMDRGTPQLDSNVSVTITVLNVNDEMPRFVSESVSKQVNETNDTGSIIYTMSASDGDEDADLEYTVFWNESSARNENLEPLNISIIENILSLNKSTGALQLSHTLDREQVELISLRFQVVDLNAAPNTHQTATATLLLTVLDVDDNSPTFNAINYNAEIQENSQTDIPITLLTVDSITVSDKDKDLNSEFSLRLLDHSDVFDVIPERVRSSATVIIRVNNSSFLDYERRRHLNLTLIANETRVAKPLSSSVTIFLNITDANDHSPEFDNTTYTASIPEGSDTNTSVVTVTARDEDSILYDMDHYQLQGTPFNFGIEGTSGLIYVVNGTDLDRERQATYRLVVEAVDKGKRTSSVPLTVHLTDVNDNSPKFQRVEYNANLREGNTSFARPVQVSATDIDHGNNSVISYIISSSDPFNSNFSIDSVNGSLTPNGPIDFELLDLPTINLRVVARDHGEPSRSSVVTVAILVQDINDNTPEFAEHNHTVFVFENATDGSFVVSVSATDADKQAPNNQIMYVIDSGGSDNFRVDGKSGHISIQTGASLDRELESNYTLVIMAIDQGTPALSSSVPVYVYIQDVNDEPPSFTQVSYTSHVTENSTSAVVYRMTATDPDETPLLKYSILWDQSDAYDERDDIVNITLISAWFSINATSGEVRSAAYITDRETAERILLVVQVVDENAQENNPPQTASATLTVTMNDRNDNYPDISQGVSIRVSVSEATRVGTVIRTLDASDRDKRQTVTFSTSFSDFNITAEGRISLARKLDREKKAFESFNVFATDDGTPPLTSTASINVTVLDTNDNDPVFDMSQTSFEIPEDAANGTIVAEMYATDADEGPNANVTFFISDIPGAPSLFSINATSGEIILEKSLDREVRSSYSVDVTARDNPTFDMPRKAIQPITIVVTDINDNHPIFAQNYSTKISETTTNGTLIISVTANDADEEQNAQVWYSFENGTNKGEEFFDIDTETGAISAKKDLVGQANVYVMRVVATDMGPGNLTGSTQVTITVLDENLNAPQFVNETDIAPLPECARSGSTIHTFYATDKDKDKDNNGKITFTFSVDTPDETKDHFTLDKKGVLTTNSQLDSERISSFTLKVNASDHGIPRLETISKQYTIKLKDVNDNPPRFNGTGTFNVNEDTANVTIGSFQARDPDKDSVICYLLDSSNRYYPYLEVQNPDNRTAVIYVKEEFDRENVSSITIGVTADDCSPSSYSGLCENRTNIKQSDSTTITITINDLNDNPPVYTKRLLSAGIRNNAEVGKIIMRLDEFVTDADTPINSQHGFYLANQTEADSQLRPTGARQEQFSSALVLTVNGTVSTNMKFTSADVGYFTMFVAVNDSAGMDLAEIRIYIIADFQRLKITFQQSMNQLRNNKDKIVEELSKATGLTYVINDEIGSHTETDGKVNPFKSELSVHAVDPATGKILDAKRAQNVIDVNQKLNNVLITKYHVLEIGEAAATTAGETDSERQTYILIAVICLLTFTLVLLITISCSRIHRYRRKLKAATIEVQAPSKPSVTTAGVVNINPIFNKEIVLRDEQNSDTASATSDDSLDNNAVNVSPVRGTDEQEVTVNFFDETHQIRYHDKFRDETMRQYDFIDEELDQRRHDVGESGSSGSERGDPRKSRRMVSLGGSLESMEDLESTEI